jgi:hypothetical protein
MLEISMLKVWIVVFYGLLHWFEGLKFSTPANGYPMAIFF